MSYCELGRDCRCPKGYDIDCSNWKRTDEPPLCPCTQQPLAQCACDGFSDFHTIYDGHIPVSPEHPALDDPRSTDRSLGMAFLMDDVRAFHRATDTPVLDRPTLPDIARRLLRLRLLDEEVDELHACIKTVFAADHDLALVEAADALADIIYICVGTALEFGIPLDAVWNEVQRTNMAKIDPATGKVTRRIDGKILKPEGWQPPDIAGALSR